MSWGSFPSRDGAGIFPLPLTCLLLSIALQIAAAPATSPTTMAATDWDLMRGITPVAYTCARASGPIMIDGKLDDRAWRGAPWTDDFVDIEGARKPLPRFRTRAKMLWDDEYFYVAAELAEPHVCATLTKKNSVIYQDNDFEIFIDPDGDNHDYYEFEVNAHNTIWELHLPKPYRDGGDPKLGANIDGLRSAVHVSGSINDPRDTDEGWSVEVAIPWAGLKQYNDGRATPPRTGDVWRVNFSRVQWTYDVTDGRYVKRPRERQPEDNWVWSPQGVIDMHRPERWGIVLFSDRAGTRVPSEVMNEISLRDRLTEVYYRQHAFRKANGRWAGSLHELGIDKPAIRMSRSGDAWTAVETESGRRFSITSDSRLRAD